MKKFRITLLTLLISIVLVLTLLLKGCNYQAVDLTYKYNYDYIEIGNQTIEGKVDAWRDYEGEQLQIVINGITYLTSSNNVVLIYDPKLKDNYGDEDDE